MQIIFQDPYCLPEPPHDGQRRPSREPLLVSGKYCHNKAD